MEKEQRVVPASLFGMVLGLAGLGGDWRAATVLWGLPVWTGSAVALLAAAVWLALLALYAAKWIDARDQAEAEIRHPVQCCFVALVPVSTLLMGMAVLPHSRALALGLCTVGGMAAMLFAVWRHAGLWHGGRSPATTTPVLYLPTVAANFVSAMAAAALGWPSLAQCFFGAGVLAWLATESVILHRLLTAEEMPPALRPTLGIQLAPPCVGLLAYASVSPHPADLVARMMLGYGLLQALLLVRLLPWITDGWRFSPGLWSFSFGLTALAGGALRFSQRGGDPLFDTLAAPLFVLANLVVGGLLLATTVALLKGRLLSPPVVLPTPQAPAPSQAQAQTQR